MPNTNHPLPRSTHRLLIFGQLVIVASLALFIGVLIFSTVAASCGSEALDMDIRADLLDEPFEGELTTPMRLLSILFLPLSTFTGLIALGLTFRLFAVYRRGDIFTTLAARRLRVIGWMIFLMAPLGMFMGSLGKAIFANWVRPGHVHVSLQLNDGEIYALVFGLLIVIVAQVMVKATEISEENEAII